ncbi:MULTISPECIES: cell division protein ZapA [Anaerofustis]|uniref:cell division protein ZapA n=1 Tax=Anaerofustis TaxID=264995 RepID=UPI001105F6CF|nr:MULTISPECIES: cell division protein ZapA [Anaerofustis]MCO8194365.1 cell division protein ZapA [Anaerofustis sp. NSJ-163]
MEEKSTAKNRVVVNILGSNYTIITDNDEEQLKKVAGFVDELIRQVKKNNPYMNPYTAAVLSSLNLCEELFELKDEVEDLRKDKEEYEILTDYKEKLMSALEEAEANEAKRLSMQYKYEKMEIENEELKDLLEEYKEKFTSMRSEIELNRRSISELQNKLLENQIELVKARKNILDYSS